MQFASASADGTIRVWTLHDGRLDDPRRPHRRRDERRLLAEWPAAGVRERQTGPSGSGAAADWVMRRAVVHPAWRATLGGLSFPPALSRFSPSRTTTPTRSTSGASTRTCCSAARPPPTPAATSTRRSCSLGDTGVGKSGLGLVLSGQPYRADRLDARPQRLGLRASRDDPATGSQTREVLLWDLAGQPGYRLVHQLHLNEVAVALVVFDARSETDPFAGVQALDAGPRASAPGWRATPRFRCGCSSSPHGPIAAALP